MNKNSKTKMKKVITKKDIKRVFSNIYNFFKSHKIITYITGGVVLLLIIIIVICKIVNYNSLNKDIMKINNTTFTKSDYMIYLYSGKHNYFGEDVDKITEDSLNVLIDEENNIKVRDKLKENALTELKTAAIINEYAKTNNIKISKKDKDILESEKKSYIKSLGGSHEFKKFLQDNDILEESYDKMAQTDYLYTKILEELYGENELYDLSEPEKEIAKINYPNNYFKIEQVVLLTIDPSTKNNLLDTEINGKKVIGQSVKEMADKGSDFSELIKKYSEDATDKEPPYYAYYKKGELVEELENVIVSMDTGQISEVVQTKYALHIIHKLEMDDSKYNDYLDQLREDKFLQTLYEELDEAKIVYYDAYKKIKF